MCLENYIPRTNKQLVCSYECNLVYRSRINRTTQKANLRKNSDNHAKKLKQANAKKRETKTDIRSVAIKAGFRSGLEMKADQIMKDWGLTFQYEPHKISYIQPKQIRSYLPDFYIPEYDLYIECKGRLTSPDRKKMLLLVEQHPDKQFLMVFGQPNNTISKNSRTTYADWCKKNNIMCTSLQAIEENFLEILCQLSITKQTTVGKSKTPPKQNKRRSSKSPQTTLLNSLDKILPNAS